MDYLRQVQRGIDHIEANLERTLELRDVSRVAGISHWHFQRIFKALTGETLKTYVRSRRLANALDLLLTTDTRILDIALRSGFESQESFTRAFKRSFGVTPNRYRKLGDRSLFLKKVRFDADYLRHINHNVSLVPELVERPAMVLVGVCTRVYGVDSDKNNIGAELPALWASFLPRLAEIEGCIPGVCYGVIQPAQSEGELLEYDAAVQVPADMDLPPPAGMRRIELPARRVATFTHTGFARDIDRTVNYIYSTWLAQAELRHTYGPDLEIYGSRWRADAEDSVMHYAIPVA